MKKICVCLFLSMICGVFFLQASDLGVAHEKLMKIRYMPEKPTLKVLLTKDREAIHVEVQGAHNIYDPLTGTKLDSAFVGSSYYMYPTTDGVRWGQEFPGTYQILIVPDEPASNGVTVNGTTYGGVVAFYQIRDKLAAVNWVSLEEFTTCMLSGIFLPQEGDQREALASYAVLIRSKAYERMIFPANKFWDLHGEVCGYKGRSALRLDEPFVQALLGSKRVVMTPDEESEGPTKQAQADMLETMPFDQVLLFAQDGRSARHIIQHFYPKAEFQLISPQGA